MFAPSQSNAPPNRGTSSGTAPRFHPDARRAEACPCCTSNGPSPQSLELEASRRREKQSTGRARTHHLFFSVPPMSSEVPPDEQAEPIVPSEPRLSRSGHVERRGHKGTEENNHETSQERLNGGSTGLRTEPRALSPRQPLRPVTTRPPNNPHAPESGNSLVRATGHHHMSRQRYERIEFQELGARCCS